MPVAFGSASPAATGEEVTGITSSSWTIGAGSNIAVFGGAIGTGFGGHSPAAEMKLGGSSGTALTKIGSDMTFPTLTDGSAWRLSGVSAGATSVYASWASAPQFSLGHAVAYTGVDTTTPAGTPATNTLQIDETGSGTISVDVTGVPAGGVVLAYVVTEKGDLGTLTLTPGTGCTNRSEQSDPGSNTVGVWLERTSAGGGTVPMALDISGSNSGGSGYIEIIAFVANAASGGGGGGSQPPIITCMGI